MEAIDEPLDDLRGFPKLATLRRLRVHVKSARGIQKAAALERLDITTGETALYEITRVKSLTHLTIRGPIHDLLDASKLPKLRELVVHSSVNCSFVKSRTVERIDFTTTPLTDLVALTTRKLTHLRLCDTPLVELNGIFDENALRRIELDATRVQAIGSDTDALLRSLGKQLKIVDGRRLLDYAAFAATKQIIVH